MAQIWDTLRSEQYIGLEPWAWIQFEKRRAAGSPAVSRWGGARGGGQSHEAHAQLLSGVETAISDVFSRRSSLEDGVDVGCWKTPMPSW